MDELKEQVDFLTKIVSNQLKQNAELLDLLHKLLEKKEGK